MLGDLVRELAADAAPERSLCAGRRRWVAAAAGRACSVTGRCRARFGECCGHACRACTDCRKVRVYARVMRLVSLLPSATEIVYALGLGDQLAGVTFECDEPATARAEKTVVVGGLDTRGMTPREIDDYVRGQLATDGNLYTLHERALADLQPDLILTQDLCAVCALPSGQVEAALGYLGCQARVLTLDPRTLDEVLDSIIAVGQATGVPGRADRLVAGLRARLAAVTARVAGRPRPKAAVIEWVDPPFTAGHWVPDLVTAAGGQPVAARPGAPSVPVSWA